MNAQEDFNEGLSVEEAIATVVAELPEPVQRFVTGPERDKVSLELTEKHNLHADQAGEFEHAFIFLLLGLRTPEEFVRELREAKLPEATVQSLAADVNDRVFKKLRQEEQAVSSSPNTPKPLQVPIMQVGNRDEVPANLPGQTAPPPVPAATLPHTLTASQAPASYAPVPIPVHPPQYIPHPVYLVPAPPPAYQMPQPAPVYGPPNPQSALEHHARAARTMANDMEIASHTPPTQYPPASQQATAPPISHNYPPITTAPVRLTPVDRGHPNAPITKEYGSDPYREVIE